MPRKQELVWTKSGQGDGQWCKTIKGKKKYFGKGRSKSNQEDYKIALNAYHNYLKELDKNPTLVSKTPKEIKEDKELKKNPKKVKRNTNTQ